MHLRVARYLFYISVAAIAATSAESMIDEAKNSRRPGRPLRLQRGFANIALLVPADLQIACISCKPLTLTKGLPWYDIPERPAAFRVVFEDRVETAPFLRGASRALAARRLAAHLETRLASRHL